MTDANVLRYHLVGIIDVLGQRSLLRQLKSMPTNEQETERVGKILRETVGFVRLMRESFDGYIQRFQAPTEVGLAIPEEKRALFLKLRRSEIVVRGVSDALIISVAICQENSFCNSAAGVFGALTGICSMCLTALAAGKVFRGGIDVGLGIEVAKGEVYGAALERAYELEAHVAQSPRIVLGSEALRFMEALSVMGEDTPAARLSKSINGLCRSLVVRDTDGQPVLDFLGETFRRQAGQARDNLVPLLEKAFGFVLDEEVRRRGGPDPSVHAKYLALRRYLESRLPAWGIAVNREST